ncbi:MAG: T9SS type A sorting domain-containing protein, partial [Bacteroidia bacterium]
GNLESASAFIGIEVTAGNVNVGNIAGNVIGSTTANNSIYILSEATINSENYGIIYNGTGIVANNVIAGITVDGTAASNPNSFTAIKVSNPAATVTGNIIGNTSFPNSINAANSSTSSLGQYIKGIAGNAASISNNIISNLNNNYAGTASSGITRGIDASPTSSLTISGNTIKNLSTSSANTSLGSNASMAGIALNSTSYGFSITQNIIDSIISTNTGAAVCLTGIYYFSSTNSGNSISRNFIHSLSLNSSSASAQIQGIYLDAGIVDVTNNMIRLGISPNGTSMTNSCQVTGIFKANTNDENFFFNSVYIGGNNVGTNTANTYCFRRTGMGADVIYNNIFYNSRSNATTGGKHYTIGLNSAGSLLSNYNIMLTQSTPFGVVGGNDYNSLYSYRAATLLDTNSGSVNPNFVNPNGNYTSVDLHVSGTTPVESNGTSVSSVSVDFDGQNRSSFTPVDIGADAGNFIWTALPVSWLNFDAAWANNKQDALITWTTASEQNSAYFEVERSNEGSNFETITKIKAAGNSNTIHSYEYLDPLAEKSVSQFSVFYYRIRETDKNGSYSFTDIRTLSNAQNNTDLFVNVFPNPYSNKLTLYFELMNRENLQIVISDLNGKIILENSLTFEKGRQYLNLDEAADLTPGIYFLKIQRDGEIRNLKLVKTN